MPSLTPTDYAGQSFRNLFNSGGVSLPDMVSGRMPPIVAQPPPTIVDPGMIVEGPTHTLPDGRTAMGPGSVFDAPAPLPNRSGPGVFDAPAPLPGAGGGASGGVLGSILDTVLGRSSAPPLPTSGTPPFLDTSGGGNHDMRNLAIAVALRALGPAIFGKRTRMGWGNLTGPLIAGNLGNMLGGRDEQERVQRQALAQAMIQSGQYTITPPTPGAPPIGNFGGMPIYKQGTLADKFPKIFQPHADVPSSTTWTPTSGSLPEGAGVKPPPTIPMSTPSDAMQIYGGLPATQAGVGGVAKMLADQEALKRQAATTAAILQGGVGGGAGAAGDMESSLTLGVGDKGTLKASRTFKPKHQKPPSVSQQKWDMMNDAQKQASLEGKQSELAQDVILENRRRENLNPPLPAMNPAETLDFRASRHASGANLVAASQSTGGIQQDINKGSQTLQKLAAVLPPQYVSTAMDPSNKWDQLLQDPTVKQAIDKAGVRLMDPKLVPFGQKLSDVISAQRQILQRNKAEWQQAWGTIKTGRPPTPNAAPAAAPVNTIPGALQQMYR